MKNLFLLTILTINQLLFAQIIDEEKLLSGPMQGHTSATSTNIWLMIKNKALVEVKLKDLVSGEEQILMKHTDSIPHFDKIFPLTFHFSNLKSNTIYDLDIKLNGKMVRKNMFVKTLHSGENKDFSFLTGSCALWVPKGMRWLHPGNEERIYPHMKKAPGEFMIWLGDYLYYFPKHYKSAEMMFKRYVNTRRHNLHMDFMRSRPQYSIWDDHEYGSNDSGKDFILKEHSLKLHQLFWPNPSFGTPEVPGIFFKFAYQDAEFFMTDGRYYRTERNMPDGEMLGEEQLQWLMNALKKSTATFKFIATGTQVLNRFSANESYSQFPQEMKKLFDFLEAEKISGVIFLTGDRHHTELIKRDRENAYPLYDFTCSAITSFRRKTSRSPEKNNSDRVPGTLIDKQNYGHIKISGEPGKRVCTFETFNNRGKLIWTYNVSENDLKYFK